MPNIFEAVKSVMETQIDDEPKSPLHIGEAMTCWTYLTMLEEERALVQTGLNTTTDNQLLEALKAAEKIDNSQEPSKYLFMTPGLASFLMAWSGQGAVQLFTYGNVLANEKCKKRGSKFGIRIVGYRSPSVYFKHCRHISTGPA